VRLLSANAARILALFVNSPHRPLYGYELMQATGIKSGSLYPVLGRFEANGWIEGHMEESIGGRPARRIYTVEAAALPQARAALDRYFEAKGVPAEEQMTWGTL
jgi:DNA-binding PadR family transcriptional regulator